MDQVYTLLPQFLLANTICACSFLAMGHVSVQKNMLKLRDEDLLVVYKRTH